MSDKSILIVSTNWIGDAVMSMPAVQVFRQENPDAEITMLARPGVADLWEMNPAVDFVETQMRKESPVSLIKNLKQADFECAYIFPNSFRSASIPYRAGIPKRVGAKGHWRRFMLTDVIRLGDGHQQFEAMNILGVQGDPPAPQLTVPITAFPLLQGQRVVTLLPGAARGSSKRWPPERFVELACRLRDERGVLVVLSGGPDDSVSCAEMVHQIGTGAISMAGKTTVPEWAALLKKSDCVVANDSGGMHLAAAVGTPVAAIFGITDPKRTGPLGTYIILKKSERCSRNIPRESEEAARALSSVETAEVFDAVSSLLPEC